MDVVPPAEGDKREQALGAMAMPALANEQRGKHDAVLDFFIEKHQQDAELVIDTVVDLLKRRGLLSPDEFTSGLTESGYLAAWRRHVAGALDRSVEVGGAAGPPAPAVAPGEAATVTEDMLELPVAVAKSAQKALEKAKAEAAAMAGYGLSPPVATPGKRKYELGRIVLSRACWCWLQRIRWRVHGDQGWDAEQTRWVQPCLLLPSQPGGWQVHLPPRTACLP